MLNEKGFNQAIKAIQGKGEELATAIHEAGLFAIAQANEHGNVGFGVRLIEAMDKKHDRQRVVNWLVRFGKFGVSKGILVYKKRKDIGAENLEATLAAAAAMPYWELTPQKPLVEKIDYLAMLRSIVSKAKAAEKKKAEGKEVDEHNATVLVEITALLDKHTPKAAAV